MGVSKRENLKNLFTRKGFTEVPVMFELCPDLVDTCREQHGTDDYFEYFDFPWRNVDLPVLPNTDPVDWEGDFFNTKFQPATRWDEWGVGHEPGSEAAKHMTRMLHPMKEFDSIEQFEAYPYPDYMHSDTSMLVPAIEKIHKKGLAATVHLNCTIWERAWYTRSMEELMMDMMEGNELAEYHLDRITEISIKNAIDFASAGVDHILFGDDIGMQFTIMMSTELYREWIKPRLKKVIQAAKSVNPEVIISYHSCGYIVPFIQDLIDVGVEVLNPIQPECMDFNELHAEFGDRLSFWGTIGTQTTMPFGTPEEVKEVIKRNLEIAGEKGGLLCTPSHMVEPEVPWENVLAYVEACREYTS